MKSVPFPPPAVWFVASITAQRFVFASVMSFDLLSRLSVDINYAFTLRVYFIKDVTFRKEEIDSKIQQ